MKLPESCPKLSSRELLFKVFCSLVPTFEELRNYYLLKSQSGRFNLSEVGISKSEMSLFKNYGVASKNSIISLYNYYWLDVFGFCRDLGELPSTSSVPWIVRSNANKTNKVIK